MFPLCGDFEFADTSEPYESAGTFLCIDHWIVNFANCVGKKINRIKIAILHVMHTSSAIYSDISVYVIRYIFKLEYRVYKTYSRHKCGIHIKFIIR